jgi:hypothetical protein
VVGEESATLLPVAIKMQREYRKLKVPVAIVAGTHDRFVGARAFGTPAYSASGKHLYPGERRGAHGAPRRAGGRCLKAQPRERNARR